MQEEINTVVIGFSNQKGGVGKTTLTHLTSKALGNDLGKKVLVLECDPQKSLSAIMEGFKEDNPSGVPAYDLIFCPIPEINKNCEKAFGKYDFVFIDMPGTLDKKGITTMLTSADIVFVPVTPSQLDLDSTAKFLEELYKVQKWKEDNGYPFFYYTVMNRYKSKIS